MNKENLFDKEPNKAIQFKHTEHVKSITHSEINEYLYDNLTISIISIFILATILFWELSDAIDKKTLAIWYGSALTVLVFRLGVLIWFRKTKHEIKLQNYHYTLFILGSSLSAGLWGKHLKCGQHMY